MRDIIISTTVCVACLLLAHPSGGPISEPGALLGQLRFHAGCTGSMVHPGKHGRARVFDRTGEPVDGGGHIVTSGGAGG